MWVMRVIGDCPKCGTANSFGNVDVYSTYVKRGCTKCAYSEGIPLPPVRKAIIYLDQNFFSAVFRKGNQRFIELADRIKQLAANQLLISPYSSIHEDETHQWKNHESLLEFIKATARGHEFLSATEVERTQVVKAFSSWLKQKTSHYLLEESDVFHGKLHEWDGYLWIDVGRYMGDIDLIRTLKTQTTQGLVGLFDDWQKSTASYHEDVEGEYHEAGRNYLRTYVDFVMRVEQGDLDAMFTAPSVSMVVQSMLYCLPEDVRYAEGFKKAAEFFLSDHFKNLPLQSIRANAFATLKAMVKAGAYKDRVKAIGKLTGFFYDIDHIGTYAPYCDAVFTDNAMADLVAKANVGRFARARFFSANNADEFGKWLDALEAGMSPEHRAGLDLAYPSK